MEDIPDHMQIWGQSSEGMCSGAREIVQQIEDCLAIAVTNSWINSSNPNFQKRKLLVWRHSEGIAPIFVVLGHPPGNV